MSDKLIQSDLLVDLSTQEQENVSGGHGFYGGGPFFGGGFRRGPFFGGGFYGRPFWRGGFHRGGRGWW